jgi:Spy/CpxP family protein refolding chaperone
MKINKVSLFAILAVGGLTTFGTLAQAQDASTNAPSTNAPTAGEHHGGGGYGKLDEKLGLTGDTKTQFDAIMKDQMEQRKALNQDDSLTPEDKKAKMKEIRDASNEKIKALLTPEQYTQYQAATKKQHKPKTEGGSGTNAPSVTPPPAPQN